MSFDSVSTSNNFISSGTLISRGMLLDGNNDNSKSKLLQPSYFNVGSAYTQSNVVRSFYDMNSGDPLIYTPTDLDYELTKKKCRMLFRRYPILDSYPWLYPYIETYPDRIEQSKTVPIYNIMGKGLGTIEFYKSGQQIQGDYIESKPLYVQNYYSFLTQGHIPLQPALKNISNKCYPYSGKLYSGNLVQFNIQSGDVTIIPYQAGRGVPQWDVTQDYYSGNPFGVPKFPNGKTIDPFLSPGAAPGNNDFCLGLCLNSSGNNKLFKYNIPDNYEPKKHKNVPYDDHPAPFTIGPVNESFNNIPKILSPENSSESYWAPWPDYYSYKPEEQTPVITKGKTTVRIGAAFNIGMQCYYEPDVEEGDDPRNNDKYVPVQIIPLFQGEKVKVGSEVYSSCMGHTITWDPRGVSPYPTSSYVSGSGNQLSGLIINDDNTFSNGQTREAREENPWYDWYDPTFGAIGWTSTPGFSLSGIPDMGVAICQSKTTDLPYLPQSLQGSAIVRAVTTTNPLESNGSGRMELIGSAEYNITNNKFQRMSKVPGTGERNNTIGDTMNEIIGTGQWTYTGSYDIDVSTYINGIYYVNGDEYNLVSLENDENGIGGVVSVTTDPTWASVATATIVNPGSGYTEGSLVRIIDKSIENYSPYSPYFVKNCATAYYSSSGSLTITGLGSNYKSSHKVFGFNIAKNFATIQINVKYADSSDVVKVGGFLGVPFQFEMTAFSNPGLFYPGKQFYALNFSASEKLTKDSALLTIEVLSNDGTTIIVRALGGFSSETFSYLDGINLYAIHMTDIIEPMELSIVANERGEIQSIKPTTFGRGNEPGDPILVYQNGSDNNCIFQLDYTIETSNSTLTLIEGGSGYTFEQITPGKWVPQDNNYVELYQTDGSSTNITMRMQNCTNNGNINSISWSFEEDFPQSSNYNNLDLTVMTSEIGTKQILQQTQNYQFETEPVAWPGGNGWDNNVIRNNATFFLDIRPSISVKGSGYSVGTYNVTGGSGTGLTLSVNQVSSSGEVLDISVETYGSGYMYRDVVTLTGGDNTARCVLYIPRTDYNQNIYPDLEGVLGRLPISIMNFDYEIMNNGSGYSISTTLLTTECPNRTGDLMLVMIDDVDTDGGVLALTIIYLGNFVYNIDNIVTITSGGNNDCYFKLKRPIQTEPIKWVSNGSNYTTETNVPTFNMQQQNMILFSEVVAGAVTPYDLTDPTYQRPTAMDLSRYQVGDQLEIIQGTNVSAVYEIATLDVTNNYITFTQISGGTGYTFVNNSNGWFQTNNTSVTPTTVDITTNSDGEITDVQLNTIGDRLRYGDDLIIQQPGSNNNAVVRINPLKNVTPWWEEKINNRSPTAQQWNDYKETLKSSVNLFDNQVVVDLKPEYPNYMNNSYYYAGDGGKEYINSTGEGFSCSLL